MDKRKYDEKCTEQNNSRRQDTDNSSQFIKLRFIYYVSRFSVHLREKLGLALVGFWNPEIQS